MGVGGIGGIISVLRNNSSLSLPRMCIRTAVKDPTYPTYPIRGDIVELSGQVLIDLPPLPSALSTSCNSSADTHPGS